LNDKQLTITGQTHTIPLLFIKLQHPDKPNSQSKTAPRHRYHLTNRHRNETVLKLARNANTDGIVNCLLQPGQLRNQLYKSMLSTTIHLLNFVYPDSSCCRDKVSRAAGRRSVGSVFCSPFITLPPSRYM
jgi:hypothetical protein